MLCYIACMLQKHFKDMQFPECGRLSAFHWKSKLLKAAPSHLTLGPLRFLHVSKNQVMKNL